jgi:hypothetical protein
VDAHVTAFGAGRSRLLRGSLRRDAAVFGGLALRSDHGAVLLWCRHERRHSGGAVLAARGIRARRWPAPTGATLAQARVHDHLDGLPKSSHLRVTNTSSRQGLVAFYLPDAASPRDTRAALRSADARRSIETTRTPCSCGSTPRARTRQRIAIAPCRHHRRRRRDSHAACS